MGFLDNFLGQSGGSGFLGGDMGADPRQMGMLGLATGLLNASGPSRTPVALGQAMAQGLTGYQQGMQSANEQALRALQMKQLGIGMEKSGLEVQQLRDTVDRQKRIRERTMGLAKPPAAETQMGNEPAASFTPGGEGSPKVGGPDWMQSYQPAPQPQAAGSASRSPVNVSEMLTRQAKIYQEEGDFDGSMKLYEQAAKFMPKVKNWEKTNQGGKIMFTPYFEDGTAGNPVPYEVAEKLEFRNLGGTTVGVNPFTGQQAVNFKNTQSPDSMASNAVTIRGQNMTDSRARDTANKVQHVMVGDAPMVFSPASGQYAPATGPTGAPMPRVEKPLTESQGKATAFSSRMSNSDQIINGLVASGTKTPSILKQSLEGIPLIGNSLGMSANYFVGEDKQKMEQAQRDFVNAVLRQESGAAISPTEFDSARKQYFPVPGEPESVTQQKARNRQIAIEGMKAQAGPGAGKSDAIANTGKQPNQPASKFFNIDGGGSVAAKLGTDGNYYVERNGKKFRVEE